MYEIKELIKVLKSGNDGNDKKKQQQRKLLSKDRSENKRWIELEI